MAITSAGICAAADPLQGFVGFNRKTSQHIARFSEGSFGLDVTEDSITPASEFVWQAADNADLMTLKRDRLRLLVDLRIDERLNHCTSTCAATTCRKSAPYACCGAAPDTGGKGG